jgi:hypothetical protein
MHRALIGFVIVSLGILAGCNGSGSRSAPPPASHDGLMVELSESRGFVEIKTEGTTPPATGGRKAPGQSRILAYFYKTDSTTAMSPAPTDVKVSIAGEAVSLAPQTSAPNQFASQPGNYPHEFRGEIEFQLEGTPVKADFAIR